jgi:hypothetical protein
METEQKDKVPLFKKWSHWYALAIAWLLVQILAFYLLTQYFS